MSEQLLFASVDGLPLFDKELAAKQILEIDHKFSFWDEYRYTRMFPLMTKGGLGKEGTTNQQSGDFHWLEHTPKVIIDWFENHVFEWLGEKSRIMALITQPGISNYEHIDCGPNEVGSRQHKFRIVLQGKTSTLYWNTQTGIVNAPDIDGPFIMDGGWPHGMTNSTNEVKVTIALGAPWTGKDHYDDITILQSRTDLVMPNDLSRFFKK